MDKSALLGKIYRDDFLAQYFETALWSSTDWDTNRPFDEDYYVDDFTASSLKEMIDDAEAFYGAAEETMGEEDFDEGQMGHDFWLTRNGHGAGFWDGAWTEPYATELTDFAHSYGELDIMPDGRGGLTV